MSSKTNLMIKTGLIAAFSALLIFGCESNPTDPSIVPDENAAVKKATENSVGFYSTVASVQNVGDLMRGADAAVELEKVDINNPSGAYMRAKLAKQAVLADIAAHPDRLNKISGVTGDSLVWEFTKRKEFEGFTETVRLFYDAATGKARVEAVKFAFDDRHWLRYDSANVALDLNSTLLDDSDDLLLSLENLKQYKDGHHLQEEWAKFVPDAYTPGSEPDGGILESHTTYIESSFISKTVEKVEFHAGTGGSWQKTVDYSDGSTSSEKATFTEDGKGTFEEIRRDGTKITGSFDSAEEDGEGSFEKTTEFPAGSDPASIHEAGTFRMNAADSTLHGSFSKEVRFKDGKVLRESIQVDESIVNGIKTTTIKIEKQDGSKGTITVEERPDGSRVSGDWTEASGAFYIFTIDYYPDGSARLEFSGWASEQDHKDGKPPVVKGIINFNPDSSGSGNVTEGSENHTVIIGSDGSQSIGS
ncbi:MAG: hypothetical protein ACE5I1_18700 [bacterium]